MVTDVVVLSALFDFAVEEERIRKNSAQVQSLKFRLWKKGFQPFTDLGNGNA